MTMDTLQKANEINKRINVLLNYKITLDNESINNGRKLEAVGDAWLRTIPYDDDFLDPVIGMLYEVIDAKIAEEREELEKL